MPALSSSSCARCSHPEPIRPALTGFAYAWRGELHEHVRAAFALLKPRERLRLLARSAGAGGSARHRGRRARRLAALALGRVDDCDRPGVRQIALDRALAEDPVADGVGSRLAQVVEEVLVGASGDARRQRQLGKLLGHGAAGEATRPSILQNIGDTLAKPAQTLRALRQVVVIAFESVEPTDFNGVPSDSIRYRGQREPTPPIDRDRP